MCDCLPVLENNGYNSFSLIILFPSTLSFLFSVEISVSFRISANTRLIKVAVSIPDLLN